MKYFDFFGQLIIVMFVAVFVLINFLSPESPIIAFAFCGQLFLGPWQLVSSLISVTNRAELYNQKKKHLILSAGYLISLVFCLIGFKGLPVSPFFMGIFATVPAWCLAFYYLYLSFRIAFPKMPNGTFLRHINF